MNTSLIWFAAAGWGNIRQIIHTWISSNAKDFDRTLVSGAILLVVCALLAWAVFIRKRGRPRYCRHPHLHHGRSLVPALNKTPKDGRGGPSFLRSRRRRRRRREAWPLNPTLAETGGLPPLRVHEPKPPGAPL